MKTSAAICALTPLVDDRTGRVAELADLDPALGRRLLLGLDPVDVVAQRGRRRRSQPDRLVRGGRLGEDGDDRQVAGLFSKRSR